MLSQMYRKASPSVTPTQSPRLAARARSDGALLPRLGRPRLGLGRAELPDERERATSHRSDVRGTLYSLQN